MLFDLLTPELSPGAREWSMNPVWLAATTTARMQNRGDIESIVLIRTRTNIYRVCGRPLVSGYVGLGVRTCFQMNNRNCIGDVRINVYPTVESSMACVSYNIVVSYFFSGFSRAFSVYSVSVAVTMPHFFCIHETVDLNIQLHVKYRT